MKAFILASLKNGIQVPLILQIKLLFNFLEIIIIANFVKVLPINLAKE